MHRSANILLTSLLIRDINRNIVAIDDGLASININYNLLRIDDIILYKYIYFKIIN